MGTGVSPPLAKFSEAMRLAAYAERGARGTSAQLAVVEYRTNHPQIESNASGRRKWNSALRLRNNHRCRPENWAPAVESFGSFDHEER
jgi:hypothetical protein